MNPPLPTLEAFDDCAGSNGGDWAFGTSCESAAISRLLWDCTEPGTTGGGSSLVDCSSAESAPPSGSCAPFNPSFRSSSETAFCCPEQYSQTATPAGFIWPHAAHSKNAFSLTCRLPPSRSPCATVPQVRSYRHSRFFPPGAWCNQHLIKLPPWALNIYLHP
jgi:hypothetical protein